MSISREQFESDCLSHAGIFINDIEANLRDKFISKVCKTLDTKDITNIRKLRLTLYEVYFSFIDTYRLPSTLDILTKFYPLSALEGHTRWISSSDCINVLDSVLKHNHVIARTITAYRLANCQYTVIARCLNEAIDKVREAIKDATYLQLTELLKAFHNHIVVATESILHEDLVKIIRHNENFFNCTYTLKYLSVLSAADSSVRFSRGTNPNKEKYTWLRERYNEAVNHVRNNLYVKDFQV